MKKIFKNESTQYIAFVAIVLLSRVPFLFSGYGLDADSWEVALTAKHISETHAYEASRLPGFPVHELICSLFYNGSYVSLNLLSTIISTIGFLFFALTLKALRFKDVFLASFALAAVPVVYIHSTTTIDYTWALAFILISFYFVVKDKAVTAGLFLGIAIGCRITSGAMLLPFAIMISQTGEGRKNILRIVKLAFATCVTGAILFLPAWLKYGDSFFTYYDVPYPSIPKVLYKLTIDTWGVIGSAGIIIATCLLFLPNKITRRKYLFPRSVNEKYVVGWLVAIDLYIIAFLKLPMESGYLIPIAPFVILVFGKYLFDRAFTFFAVTLIIAPFIFGISPANRKDSPVESPAAVHFNPGGETMVFDAMLGPVFAYQSQRVQAMKFVAEIIHSLDTIHKKTLIVSGRWFTQITMMQPDSSKKTIVFVDYLNQETLSKQIEQGFDAFYLPQQDYYNLLKNGYDIKFFGTLPYIKEKITPE